MRLRIKKANDTEFASRYKREYEDVLVEAINTLPEEYQQLDIVPSTENKANLVIFNYETNEMIKASDLNDEINKFLDLVNKELNKKDLVIAVKKEGSSEFFKVFTKEDYAAMKDREKAIKQMELEKLNKKQAKKEEFNLIIQNMVDQINERYEDFIIWNEPSFRIQRDGRITPSFRYNRENPDYTDDIKQEIQVFVSELNIREPEEEEEELNWEFDE